MFLAFAPTYNRLVLFFIGLLFLNAIPSFCAANRSLVDSLLFALRNSANDSQKVALLAQISQEYAENISVDSGLIYANRAMALSRQTGSLELEFIGLKARATVYRTKGDLPQALALYDSALVICRELKRPESEFPILNGIGNIYVTQGNYPRALRLFNETLALAERLKRKRSVSIALNNLGNVYFYQREFKKALEYYLKTLMIDRENGDKSGETSTLGNIGNTYNALGNEKKATESFMDALSIARKEGLKWDEANTLNSLGVLDMENNRVAEALVWFQEALPISEKLGDPSLLLNLWNNIGQSKFKLGQYAEARAFCMKALSEGRKMEALPSVCQTVQTLAQIDSARGDLLSAFRFQKMYIQLNDSIFNADKSRDIGRIEAQYEFEKKEMESRRANELAQEAARRRNNLQYLAIFSLVALIFIGLFMLGRFRLPEMASNALVFLAFLLFFEFLLILFDPILDPYTGGVPYIKLLFNSILAAIFTPLHHWLENVLRKRFQKRRGKADVSLNNSKENVEENNAK